MPPTRGVFNSSCSLCILGKSGAVIVPFREYFFHILYLKKKCVATGVSKSPKKKATAVGTKILTKSKYINQIIALFSKLLAGSTFHNTLSRAVPVHRRFRILLRIYRNGYCDSPCHTYKFCARVLMSFVFLIYHQVDRKSISWESEFSFFC